MKSRSVAQWTKAFLESHTMRANSLIISVYGDAVAPHGGTVWLGSFIRLVAPLGLNPRMVRTSVFRLSKEKWLVSEQIGRRSYYSLTATGRRRFEHAYRRIYDDARDRLVFPGRWRQLGGLGGGLPRSAAPANDGGSCRTGHHFGAAESGRLVSAAAVSVDARPRDRLLGVRPRGAHP